MEEIDIPSHFICPISMQLMRDPVTVSTGITYERESIESWLFSWKNNTCPVTKQVLAVDSYYLTPNHNLRRLIQAWCSVNASNGAEWIPTPKQPADEAQIVKILKEAEKFPQRRLKCLRRLKSIANGNDSNKKSMESAGAVEFLASIIKKNESMVVLEEDESDSLKLINDEALNILCSLGSNISLKKLIDEQNGLEESLIHVLKNGSYQSRVYAIILMTSAFKEAEAQHILAAKSDVFVEVVDILHDMISQQATLAAVKLLAVLCPWGRNRIKAIQCGAVAALIELLLDTMAERRLCELALVVLDTLCGCAEGRAELLQHAAGLAVVSKKILRVSNLASDKAMKILSSISRFSATVKVVQKMLEEGVVSKLCLVLQVDCSSKTKERAKEMLRLHSRAWRNSPCVPPHLLSSYPDI